MKIIYCISGTFNSGGMERVLANKANYLSNIGHEVSIVTTDQKNRKPYFKLNSNIVHYDLGIDYADHSSDGLLAKIISYSRNQKKHYKLLNQLLLKLNADIVISMFDHDASFIHKIKDGSRKVLEIHFSRYKRLQYGRGGVWKLVDQYRSKQDLEHVKKFDAFVVLTEEDKGYWGDLSKISVIPNMNSFVPKEQAQLKNQRVIAVGRYDYQKNFEELINCWLAVYLEHPDWKLDIFGSGPQKDVLQTLIEELDLENSIKLRPSVKDIESEYLKSSMIAMTSRYEGLPMALLEAQSCGLPLVSYACKCGPRDIIKNEENGFLVDYGDTKKLSNSIIELIENVDLRNRMGDRSFELSSNFSEKIVMEKWLNLFQSLMNKNL